MDTVPREMVRNTLYYIDRTENKYQGMFGYHKTISDNKEVIAIPCYINGLNLIDSGYLLIGNNNGFEVFGIAPKDNKIKVARITETGIQEELFFGRNYYTPKVLEEIAENLKDYPKELEESIKALAGVGDRIHLCHSNGFWSNIAEEDNREGIFKIVNPEIAEEIAGLYISTINN